MDCYDVYHQALDKEIDNICNDMKTKGLNDVSLDHLQKLTDTKKNFLKIEKLQKERNEGYQGDSYRYNGNSYGGPYYRNSMGNYDVRMPQNGSYGWDNGYSRDEGGDTYSHLEEAMRHAKTEGEREAIRQVMSKLYK
jgi:hypothetical protein